MEPWTAMSSPLSTTLICTKIFLLFHGPSWPPDDECLTFVIPDFSSSATVVTRCAPLAKSALGPAFRNNITHHDWLHGDK